MLLLFFSSPDTFDTGHREIWFLFFPDPPPPNLTPNGRSFYPKGSNHQLGDALFFPPEAHDTQDGKGLHSVACIPHSGMWQTKGAPRTGGIFSGGVPSNQPGVRHLMMVFPSFPFNTFAVCFRKETKRNTCSLVVPPPKKKKTHPCGYGPVWLKH